MISKEETCACADLEGKKPVLQASGGRAGGDAPPLSRMPIGQPQVSERGGRGLNQTGRTGERATGMLASAAVSISELVCSQKSIRRKMTKIRANVFIDDLKLFTVFL